MSEAQLPSECAKCHFHFPLVSGIQFNFCPVCGCQTRGHENLTEKSTLDDSSTKSYHHKLSENNVTDKSDTNHVDPQQEKIPDSTTEASSVEHAISPTGSAESAISPAGSADGVSNPGRVEPANSVNGVVPTDQNSSIQNGRTDMDKLSTTNENHVHEPDIDTQTVTNLVPAEEQVEENSLLEKQPDQTLDSRQTDDGESLDCLPHPSAMLLQDGNQTTMTVTPEIPEQEPDLAVVQDSVKFNVTFHVLVPLSAWSWNENSLMTIRFGDPRLSGWNNNGGALLMKRKLDDGFAEFQCTLQFPLELALNKAIIYRYLIHNGRSDTSVDVNDAPFEFLSYDGVPACRCMMIEKYISKGDYHQFDSVAMPEPKSSFGTKALRFIMRTQESPDKNFNYYQEKSLVHYLDDMKNILIKCELSLNFGIHDITKKILHVFTQLFHPKAQMLKQNPGEKAPVHVRIAKHLPEAFQDWLLSIAKALHKKKIGSAEDNAQRMASIITVILCLSEVMPSPQLPWESVTVANYSLILSMIRPMPDLISQKSLDLEILIKLIHPEEVTVARVLISFCKYLAHTKHLRNPEWLYVIPLIHFMLQQSIPFEKPEKNHDKILWDDPQLDLAKLRREKTARKTNIGVVKRNFKELKPLGALDPLFLPLFTLLCPEKELPELFLQIPLYLSAAFTLLILRDVTFSDSEVMYFTKLLQVLLVVIKQPSVDLDFECLESTLESSRIIYMQLMQKLSQTTKYSSEIIKASASLLFYTITMLKKNAPDEEIRTFIKEQSKELVQIVHIEIVRRIRKMYGNTFGSPAGVGMLLCAYEELEFCQSLYRLDCPQHIQESWQPAILQTINERIKQVPLNKRIDLFCVLETQKVVDQSIMTLFMEAVMESIHQMELTDTAQGVEKLYRGTSRMREAVGKILERTIIMQYPIETKTITFDQLLEWELWPCFIKIFSSEPKGGKTVSCLTEHCAVLSACAHSILMDTCEKLASGEAVVQDLQKMLQSRAQMEKLCSVTSHWKGLKKQHPKDDLARRLYECENFIARRELLTFLCFQVTVPVIGLAELKQELQQGYSTCPINLLCVPTKGKGPIAYLSCESATPLEPIMVKFRIMAGENSNDVFQKIWLKTLNSIRNSHTELTIEGIVEHLWEPAFEECLRLLDEIRDLTILLSTVDIYFVQYNNERHIIAHLFSLYSGVEMCNNNRRPRNSPEWLKRAVHLMVQYWKLCLYAKAAKVVLDVSAKLKITGDFSLITTLATKGMSEMKSSPLSSIDESLIDACHFLEDFGDEKKLDCLRIFVDCADIIEWIRTYTKEVNELHRFVSIALHTTAGEGDYESDKLATLRTVGTAFEPLIYGLRGDITYQIFCERCRSVWDELKKNPKLPQMLRTCNDELEWYKSLKDTQDSVNSYGEMNNILKHGTYRIGSQSTSVVKHLCNVITLKLNTTDRKITKRHYSFVELQDLESKLVLITGSKAKNRNEVDLFLDIFHGVYRVADALIELQQSGNISYLDWTMEVACGPDKVEALATQARLMENELTNWIDKVKQIRTHFYELNCFTTPQLVILRRELGPLKSARANISAVSPMVLSLLQSISIDISKDTIVKAVKDVALLPLPNLFLSPLSTVPIYDSKSNGRIPAEQEDKGTKLSMKKREKASTQKSCVLIADKLSDEQREISMYIVDRFGFPQQLVLKAFEENKGEVNRYDIQNWCMENAEKYQFFEENSDNETDSEDTVNDLKEPMTSQPTGMMGWVGQSLKHYFAPQRRHTPVKSKEQHPTPSAHIDFESHHRVPGLFIIQDSNSDRNYLSLEQLGMMLKNLPAYVYPQRPFKTPILKVGSPNLIVTFPGSVLKAVMSLYMEDESLPLPTLEEVLICNSNTTSEEVTLLWMRSVNDSPSYNRIFCLVHAERLSYQVSDKVLHSLAELTQGQTGYRLVIICSNEDEEKSLIISRLHRCRRQFAEPKNDDQFKRYLKAHFTGHVKSKVSHVFAASSVDHEKSCVRVVSSDRPGMGKSFYIQQLARSVKKIMGRTANACTIPIHGPDVTPDTMMNFLINHLQDPYCSMYHLDIASDILWKVDTILFSLLILQGLTDSQGRIWRTRSTHFFTIEATLPKKVDVAKSVEAGIYNLLNLLPSAHCPSPDEVLKLSNQGIKPNHIGPLKILMSKEEFRSATYQRVYQYLCRHKQGNVDRFSYNGKVEGSDKDCLDIILRNCGITNPSWREIKHFVEFLSIQLQSCEDSVYCNEALVGDILAGLKSFVVKFMIRMSKDFATPSLEGELSRQNQMAVTQLNQYRIDSRKRWEQSIHPYLFFNQSADGTVTFVGFKVTPQGNLVHPVNGNLLEADIMSSNLFTSLQQNQVNFSEDYTKWGKPVMVQKLCAVMGVKCLDPDTSYVLTMDNVVKILAIYMRFRCDIPVVIMGETGCGKTRLIRYMSELARQELDVRNMYIMKVHGGTTETDVREFVTFVNEAAKRNTQQGVHMTIAFFDEANTTDALGLIKEVMCDHRLNGQPISKHLKFIAACNPYRKHSDKMIEKLKNAGLGFYVRESDTTHKLGGIPLRHLVYRVLDLPPSMRPLVYDFGQLKTDTEYQYTYQVVSNHVYQHRALRSIGHQAVTAIANVLNWSQGYMRKTQDECSFVSLRDVERAMVVLVYFYDNMEVLSPLIDKHKRKHHGGSSENPTFLTRSLLLSLSVCYHARLQCRSQYEKGVAAEFRLPLNLRDGAKQLQNEIKWCQEVFLDNMRLGENIARNAALRENAFMMAVCIELRIPLFIVGKPGSSKSLAKSIIQESMKGKASRNKLMKHFKEVDIFSYQCSQLSTSESVIEVFNTAKKFQQKQDISKYVAVVVLDEVGLAEDSSNLPLKALHPLLEDGTAGGGDQSQRNFQDKVVRREERVAFIGISNWALDPAKMNRGVMVTRGDPSELELELSARGICSNKMDDPVRERLEEYFQPLAKSYIEICKKQNRQFFGLRDFYSLIKMMYWMCDKSGNPPTWPQLEHAIRRNFGGLDEATLNPLEEFKKNLPCIEQPVDLTQVPPELHQIINPDCSKLGLIKTSLSSTERTWHGESRYLLFLTENYVALDILKHYLSDIQHFDLAEQPEEMEPYILFGSSFPKDKEYTQVCRNINQIKVCMETGRTVILLNLENLYESLYDVLNQYYIYNFGNRYVDLGLQTHRVRCRVHDNFKLILIAEKETVYSQFPTPLINRLEKHFVLTSSILEEWQMEVLNQLHDWIKKFSPTRNEKFSPGHAFIGFQTDTPAAVIFQSTTFLRRLRDQGGVDTMGWKTVHSAGALQDVSPDELATLQEDSEPWKDAVLKMSKYQLLQTASPDAIVRLQSTSLAGESDTIQKIYFAKQDHSSIDSFLAFHLKHDRESQTGGLLLQVTTHSHLLSHKELSQLEDVMQMNIVSFHLHEFETELDFCNKIGPHFKEEPENAFNTLLVIQCDSNYTSSDLIACARYRVYDERAHNQKKGRIHVIFVISVPRHNTAANQHHYQSVATIGYLGDPWISAHVDDLRPSIDDASVTPHAVLGFSISELFMGKTVHESDSETTSVKPQVQLIPLHRRLQGCIQASASRLQDVTWRRATRRIEVLVSLISKYPTASVDILTFHGILVQRIAEVMRERDNILDPRKRWVLEEAMNLKKLHTGGTFGNVLARKVDEVIVPIFAYIISAVDQNYNLDLLETGSKLILPASQLWLALFQDPKVLPFSYNVIATSKDKLPGAGSRRAEEDFKCQFPFSWIVKDTVDALWSNAKRTAGDDVTGFQTQLADSFRQTNIGAILDTFELLEVHREAFGRNYLHDFVRMVHKCRHKKKDMEDLEYELIANSLNDVVSGIDTANESLLHNFAVLHIVYYENKAKIAWFSQLVSFNPGIMLSLRSTASQFQHRSEMRLHLLAVDKLLHELQPPLNKEHLKQNLVPWLNDIRMCQNTVNSIFTLSSQSQWVNELKLSWQLIQAMRMFLEHIMLHHTKVSVKYARRLETTLKQCGPDFLKASTLQKIKDSLKQIDREQRSKSSQQHIYLLTSCRQFFMEVVSTLCFGAQNAPEPELVKCLMETVFATREGSMFNTRDITPYDHETQCDEVPVIRSFLLQLLLEHNSDVVKVHLQDYFTRCCKALGVQTVDLNLCLLCIQCFEDALSRSFSDTTSEFNVKRIAETMNEGYGALLYETTPGPAHISVLFLEGLAKIRFSLSVVADILEKQVSSKQKVTTSSHITQLVYTAQNICSDLNINVIDTTGNLDTTGPTVYLMRLLVRQFGMSCLEKVTDTYSWIIPMELRSKQEDEKMLDPFVLYNEYGYSNMRESIDNAAYGKQMGQLAQLTKGMNIQGTAVLLLGVYRKVTLSRVTTSHARQIVTDVLIQLDRNISSLNAMNNEMKIMGRMLIANEQGRNLASLNVVPKQSKHIRNLAALVVHTGVVFTSKMGNMLLLPFINMLQNPAKLNNAFLPTMPEDSLYEVRKAGGQFYQCPRGHPYYVGECGRPMQEYTCNICGSKIGGRSHNLRSDNQAARTNDATKKGHDLGNPDERTSVPSPERRLSPLAVCIIRALMHSAFVWTCSSNENLLGDMAALVNPPVRPNALPEFFWKHLEKDVEVICRILKKGEDESILLVHLVLKEILMQRKYSSMLGNNSQLGNRQARNDWEVTFNDAYIRPVTETLDQSIHTAFETVTNDNDQEHDQLFYLVYERIQVSKGSIIPHMWTFQSKITLENLTQKVQEKSIKDQYPILYEFLQAEPNLRATQYLPDIVYLQQCLYDIFNFCVDRNIARSTTVGQFINTIRNDATKESFKERMQGLTKAWQLVVHKLRTHGRLRVKEEYLIPAITNETPLEYIIPTTTEAGACTTALVDFLTLTHNDFIERCRSLISRQEQSDLQTVWNGHKVPITHVNHCHLVIYEQQLQSILLSHCHYSLTAGSNHLVRYDLKALEKHVLDQFIHGKPMILADIPQVIYHKDTYTAARFGAIRRKVSPQEHLPVRVQQEILTELHTLERVHEMLDIIDIILGFLSSGGGNADKSLEEYVEEVLKMKTKKFSHKIQHFCKLGHIISLWKCLSVELARQLYFRGEEPFDSVKKELTVDLSKEEKQELDNSLRSFDDLNLLLEILFEFIQTHVQYCPAAEFEWPILDVLPSVLDQWELPEYPEFEDKFCNSIKLCQAIATWKCVVLYQRTLQV